MRIALDENLPRMIRRFFGSEHQAATVQQSGIAGTANGELLARLGAEHDVFITADESLRYQQNLTGRPLAIIELPTNRLSILMRLSDEIVAAIGSAGAGSYNQVPYPARPPESNGVAGSPDASG